MLVNLYEVADIQQWKANKANVYIGRRTVDFEESKWGNPYHVTRKCSNEKAVAKYERYIRRNSVLLKDITELAGKTLGCWCCPLACHGNVLLKILQEITSGVYMENSSFLAMASSSSNKTVVTSSADVSVISVSSSSSSPTDSSDGRRLTRSSSGTFVNSVYMKCNNRSPPPTKELLTPKRELTLETISDILEAQQLQITSQASILEKQATTIELLNQEIKSLKHDSQMIHAANMVKDYVIKSLQGEVNRLQQYTRRYSVVISGIDKPRGREDMNDLKKKVESIVTNIDCDTKVEDIDKLHRNGPARGKDQEVIVRFKSHSAKEALYKNRSNLNDRRIKIKPSLSPHNKSLLRDARDLVDSYATYDGYISGMTNPPDFVFANVHGDLQVKMKKRVQNGMFFGFSSIEELAMIITKAQMEIPVKSNNRRFKNMNAMIKDDWACPLDDSYPPSSEYDSDEDNEEL